MGRKTINLTLVLVPILLAGCGVEVPDKQQRDVYTKFEDCMADWGKPELCQKMQEEDARQFAENTTGVSGGGGSHMIYWGPNYYPGNRAVIHNGQTLIPKINHAMSKPFMVTSRSSSAAKSSPSTAHSTSTSRGGFGAGGRAAGGGHSSGG